MIVFDDLVTGGSINVHMVFEKTEFRSKSHFNYIKLQILYFWNAHVKDQQLTSCIIHGNSL